MVYLPPPIFLAHDVALGELELTLRLTALEHLLARRSPAPRTICSTHPGSPKGLLTIYTQDRREKLPAPTRFLSTRS